ncbi:MAG: Calx-beta protein [Akkermansiaceae bacterium]|nr:Calx-beta protein [Akkermansiaceae bacterium]
MKPASLSSLLLFACLAVGTAPAITIDLRYDYDSTHFFDQPGAKEALRAVADYYEVLLTDSLQRIDPTGTSNTWSAVFPNPATGAQVGLANLVVPADTVIVYVGSRPIAPAAGQGGPGGYSANGFQPWFDLLNSRGQAGALATPKTDFGPWGGAITFDPSYTWSFSTSGPVDGTTPFVSIALHEFGHLFGIGTADSWDAKISGSNFTGAAAVASYGGPVPLQSGGSHWRDDAACVLPDGYNPSNPLNVLSKAYGSFGALHGFAQIALMDPSSCSAGPFMKVMTDLDLAGLRDIGWQLAPPARWEAVQLAGSPFTFSWPSTTGTTYRVESSTTLSGWSTLTTRAGDGTIQQFSTPKPAAGAAFYRLNTGAAAAATAVGLPHLTPAPPFLAPVEVGGCRVGSSYGQHE